MPRQKPRYPLQLDNALVDLCRKYDIDAYTFECMLVAVACLSPLALGSGDSDLDAISKMLQKMAMKQPGLPYFTLAVQSALE